MTNCGGLVKVDYYTAEKVVNNYDQRLAYIKEFCNSKKEELSSIKCRSWVVWPFLKKDSNIWEECHISFFPWWVNVCSYCKNESRYMDLYTYGDYISDIKDLMSIGESGTLYLDKYQARALAVFK